jgi:hypothetical protein
VGADSFDFWIGSWDVSWDSADGGRVAGTNTINSVDGTIRELFTNADPNGAYIGASVSRWNTADGCWVQDYWDNQGYNAVFKGAMEDGQMVLARVSGSDTGPVTRLLWSEIAPDSIRWTYERQGPSGEWETAWLIDYRRRLEEPAT